MVLEIGDKNFEQEVINSEVPVLVDFWAEWCGPCRQIAPLLAELSEDMQGKLKVVKINVDNNTEIAAKIGVRGIPTLVIFKQGKQFDIKVGALSKTALTEWINKAIS